MITKRIYLLFILWGSLNLTAVAQRNHISAVINSVNTDSLLLTVKQLSGEIPVLINGATDTIKSRHSYNPGNEKAAMFIKQKLNGYGLSVSEQTFSTEGKNIIAKQQGYDAQNRCYIICAHYDNLPAGEINYGADDNASGVAAVIEAARILSKTNLRFTVYYVLFDQEEQNLVGSEYFANLFNIGAEPVLGAINLDMIAYDGNNDSVANIHTHQVSQQGKHITERMMTVNNLYHTGLNLRQITPPSYSSDHASFWKYFIPAVMFIEDDMSSDFNPFYHKITDRFFQFNNSFYERMTKVAVGTLADFATDSTNVGIDHTLAAKAKIKIYPNPVNGNTVTVYPVKEKFADVKLLNLSGELILHKISIAEHDEIILTFDDGISGGLYQLIITDGNDVHTGKIVIK